MWRQRIKRRPRAAKFEFKHGKFQPVLTEEHVLKEIVTRLWLEAKIRVARINCPVKGKVRPNEPGIPDLIGWLPNTMNCEIKFSPTRRFLTAVPLYIEVKRPGGVRRPAQELFIADARKDGCVAFFAESWTDVLRELYEAGIKLSEGVISER